MSDHIYKYIIGTIDKSRKIMVLVNYESRSNLVTQAQLMEVQFPNLNTLRMFLNDFEPSEKYVINYSKYSKEIPSGADGYFLFNEHEQKWNIFDPNVLSRFVRIYLESPEFDNYQDYICACEVKKSPKLKAKHNEQVVPEKMIFTSVGFERYCHHCNGYEPLDRFYYDIKTKTYESVCKACYVPHYKPYKIKKRMTSTIEEFL